MDTKIEGLRQRKKRELKAELAQVGLRLFTQKGFQNTSVEEIVGPLGVSTRTFFRYFPSKEDLVFAWYEDLSDELVRVLAARPKDEAPFSSVCATLDSLLHYYYDDPAGGLAMLRLSHETPALTGKSFEKRLMWEQALAGALAARLPKGPAGEWKAKVIVGAAMAAFTYGVEQWSAGGAKGDIRSILKQAYAWVKDF